LLFPGNVEIRWIGGYRSSVDIASDHERLSDEESECGTGDRGKSIPAQVRRRDWHSRHLMESDARDKRDRNCEPTGKRERSERAEAH
jgi:hypothetical protein